MIGLAGNVGTDVEPACSSRTTCRRAPRGCAPPRARTGRARPGRSRRSRSATAARVACPRTTWQALVVGRDVVRIARHFRSFHDHLPDDLSARVDDQHGYRDRLEKPRERRTQRARIAVLGLDGVAVPSGATAHSSPSAPPFAAQPGCRRMRTVSSEPSPPTSSGCARIAARIRSAPSRVAEAGERRAIRSSESANVRTPQPSTAVGISLVRSSAARATSA